MGKGCSQCRREAKGKSTLLVEASLRLEDGAEALVDIAERLAWAGCPAVFVDLWLAVSVGCIVSIIYGAIIGNCRHT
jgi:hypothetical protein